MPSPFPGMDPYLEDPVLFPDLHNGLITYLQEALQPCLPERYYAATGSRVWIDFADRMIGPDVNVLHRRPPPGGTSNAGRVALAPPRRGRRVRVQVSQDEMREPFLEIIARDGGRVVTSVEVLSPANKTPGMHGRDLYLQKQREVLRGQIHLVEIDLLRGGHHATAVPLERALAEAGPFDYHVCTRQFDRPDGFVVDAIQLPDRLPAIEIPLLPGDAPVDVDLQAVFDRCYNVGAYRRRVDYTRDPPPPPLTSEQAEWVHQVLREQGLLPPTGEPRA